jgi:uncharacterized protein
MSDKKNETVIADKALEPYWVAARNGKLLLKRCGTCGKKHYYPRPICPFCMSDNTEWLEASGNGTIYSWSVERRATPPYAMAFVTLAEGPTIMTNIIDADLSDLAIGQKVKLAFEMRDDQPVPVFRLADA